MRPTERSGYIPAVARVLFEAFPEWAETATVTEEEAVTVTNGVSVSKPCLLIRIPSPVAPRDPNRDLLVEIVEDETTIFLECMHRHLTSWGLEVAFGEHQATVVDYVRNIIMDDYVVIYFRNADGVFRTWEIVYKPDQKRLDEALTPPGATKHIWSWTGRYNADIINESAGGDTPLSFSGANNMKKYNWDAVPEDAMPAITGDILRRFVGGEQMTIARVAFSEGASMAPHKHPNEQFSVVLAGVMEFTIEGVPVRAETGEVVHLASNETHGARAITEAVVLDVFAPPRADWGEPKA